MLPFWPLWRCLGFLQAVAIVSWDDGEGFLFGNRYHAHFLFIWEGVVQVFVVLSNASRLSRFSGVDARVGLSLS
jgi:hypothetical protein